jgi:hypothetical protein
MKYLLLFILVFQSAFATAQEEDPMPAPIFKGLFDKNVTLCAGTLVWLEISTQILGETLSIGQTIRFVVKTDVLAENEVVIRSGALALGRVKATAPPTYNNPESIKIELQHVQTVDGRMAALEGDEQTIRGQFSGQSAVGNPGFLISARVTNNIEIKVD